MPQDSWLGPLSFLVLINDLSTGCPVHKYVDDTTLCEVLPPKQLSNMETYLHNLTDWATLNDMQLNTAKTKEMILGPVARANLPLLTIATTKSTTRDTIHRVTSFKLLGVYIGSTMSWTIHVDNMVKREPQLSKRDRAAGCVIVFAKSIRLELGDNILRTL